VGQVHGARLRGADDVVVKVQRPGISRVLLTFLAAAVGIMAVLLLGTSGGPMITPTVSLYAFFGYSVLVISAVLGLRVLAAIFRRTGS
jgi:ubiquinone biosynthesis protein